MILRKTIRILMLSLLLTILMMNTAIAHAKDTDFTVENGVLTAYNGSGGKVVIPDNLGIYAIGEKVFMDNSNLTSIVIPEGVTTVEANAFADCENLSSIVLPHSLTAIKERAFADCKSQSFNSIIIPNGTVTIGDSAFESCYYVTSIILPDSLTTIGIATFANCHSLQRISVPASVISIGEYAFADGKFEPISILGAAGSYAETYAKINRIAFFVTASPSSVRVLVDGKVISIAAYNIDGSNYFKLRDLASALSNTKKKFDVGYDNVAVQHDKFTVNTRVINITTGHDYTPVGGELTPIGSSKSLIVRLASTQLPVVKLYLNGKPLDCDFYKINDNYFFKLRDIADSINFGVTWDRKANTILIDTTKGYN